MSRLKAKGKKKGERGKGENEKTVTKRALSLSLSLLMSEACAAVVPSKWSRDVDPVLHKSWPLAKDGRVAGGRAGALPFSSRRVSGMASFLLRLKPNAQR